MKIVHSKFKFCFFGTFWNFFKSIFDPWFVESAVAEHIDMEG